MLNGIDISNHDWPLSPTTVPGNFCTPITRRCRHLAHPRRCLKEKENALHAEIRVTLADFAASLTLPSIERQADQVAFDLLNLLVAKPPSDVNRVELRPAFEGRLQEATPGPLGEERTDRGVRAVQEGLNHFGADVVVDGDYGSQTRAAVAE